ncbi:MAG: pyridoxal-phosphate dependent enzyme [Glaciecola sp.]
MTTAKLHLSLPSPLTPIAWPHASYGSHSINVYVKRDDLIHPQISGNKWRKLAKTVAYIQRHSIKHVVSFGGGYSNHLHALAYVCAQLDVKMTAIVRGDYSQNPTSTLQDISAWGANIRYVNKLEYKRRVDADYCQQLSRELGAQLVIPEGGSSRHALEGVATLVNECIEQLPKLSHIILPVASAGSLAGVVHQMQQVNCKASILGIGVLKGEGYLEQLCTDLLPQASATKPIPNWQILHNYHHGGYAKSSPELLAFIQQFTQHTNIPLEPVYSGKCFYALDHLLQTHYFPVQSEVLVLHTGGLQGSVAPN